MRVKSSDAAPLILACDTTQGACSAALYRDTLLATALTPMRKGHAEALMPMLAGLIEKADVTWQEIDRLAVTHGPGSFTGVRVGLSAMRGLALALQKPLKTYGSFDVMARAETAGAPLLVAVDARRDTFYVQAFNAARVPSGPPQAVSAAAALEIMTPRPLTVIGSGAEALCGLDPGVHKGGAPDWPQAEHLAAMAAADEDWAAPPPAEPLYLRPPDASLPDPTKKIALADDAKASEGPE